MSDKPNPAAVGMMNDLVRQIEPPAIGFPMSLAKAIVNHDHQARFPEAFLLELLALVVIPAHCGAEQTWTDVKIAGPDGWTVVVYYDGDEMDNIEYFITPAGEHVEWFWPRREDYEQRGAADFWPGAALRNWRV